jgi:hypothetical protein
MKALHPCSNYLHLLLLHYTPLAVVSGARKTLRLSTTATDSANSGCFVERGRRDRRSTQHAKIPSRTSDIHDLIYE